MHPKKPRNRTQIAHTAVCLGAMLAASVAFAGPPPTNAFVRDLRIVDEGSSLSASASVFGLNRKRDAYVSMQATAKLDVACINPGGKKVPSQTPNDVETDVAGYAYYPRFAIKLGRLDIDVETDRVGSQLPGAPDCPSPNWTERVERVRFVSAQVLVRQGNKIEVELLCTFNPPTNDGKIPNNRVKCFSL